MASELCRRGLYSQLTLGNHKRTDILVETETRMLRISVKAKQGSEWPSISGPIRTDGFVVFVDFASRDPGVKLDFFVLSRDDWDRLVDQVVLKQREKGKGPTIQNGTIVWPDGWRGLNLKPRDLQVYKDRWDTITPSIETETTEL